MDIRKATVDDCEELTKLRLHMRNEREPNSNMDHNFQENTCRYFRENIENDCFIAYVAVDNGNMVATSGIYFYFVPPTFENNNGAMAYIMNMYTLSEYRRQGIAIKLLDCLVHEAKARNCFKITLNASDMGKPLYQKYGFQEIHNDMALTLR